MSEPIKVLFLDRLQVQLATLTNIKSVFFGPKDNLDIETAVFPILFCFDEPQPRKRVNRYDTSNFLLHLEIWYRSEDRLREGERQYAYLTRGLWANPSWFHDLGVKVEETMYDKWYLEHDVGAIVAEYTCQMHHAANDPYTLNPTT